jgi:ATP:corrinoid adenosyltransferase
MLAPDHHRARRPPRPVAAADLITEMCAVKHPFAAQGIRAQKGIEF